MPVLFDSAGPAFKRQGEKTVIIDAFSDLLFRSPVQRLSDTMGEYYRLCATDLALYVSQSVQAVDALPYGPETDRQACIVADSLTALRDSVAQAVDAAEKGLHGFTDRLPSGTVDALRDKLADCTDAWQAFVTQVPSGEYTSLRHTGIAHAALLGAIAQAQN